MARLQLRQRLVSGWVAGCGWALASMVFAGALAGCSGGGQSVIGGSPSGAITMDAGTSVSLTASVVNDSGLQGVSWALNGPGSLGGSACTAVASSSQCVISYSAPATVAAATAVTVTATSLHTPSQSVTFSITVNAALVFTTGATLPNAAVNQAYTTTIAATGGTGALTYALAAGSTLPPGLNFTAAGVLSGKPTTAGTFTFAVKVVDLATTPNVVTQTETLIVNPAPPVITTLSLPNAATGQAYSQQIAFTGGTGVGTYSLASGMLPAGLTLSATGLVSGTPTVAAGGATYSFSVQVVSGAQTSAAQAYTLTVTTPPVVTTTALPPATTAAVYSQQLNYTAGNGGAVAWAVTSGTLPAGITLSASGLLSGKPTQLGGFVFTVTVTVGGQTSAAQSLTLTVSNLAITSGPTASGEVGLAFRFAESVLGGTAPFTWTLAAGSNPLPAGLALAANSGTISGMPATAATTAVTVKVTDATGASTTQTLTITVAPARTGAKNSSLAGQYAFLLTGFDASGAPAVMGGTLIADGAGNLTGGVLDMNGTALATPLLNQPLTASAYAVGADGRGRLTLSSGANTYVFTLAVRLGTTPSAGGYMNEFDGTGRSLSGVVLLQSAGSLTTSGINGGYAFGMQGFAGSAATHVGEVGELQATGATGTVTSGEVSSTVLGAAAVPVTSGTFSVTAGRGTASVTLATGIAGAAKLNLVLYPVSATQVLMLSADPASAATPVTAGQALAQTIANGSFTAQALNGVAVLREERVVNTATGAAASYSSDVVLGLETFSGNGTATLAGDENNAGVTSSVNAAYRYTVAANGRTAMVPSGGIGGCVNCVTTQTIAYLSGANAGFVLDFGAGSGTGMLEAQTAGLLAGNYAVGTVQPDSAGIAVSGSATIAAGALMLVADTASAGTLAADQPLVFTASAASSGRVTLTGPSTQVLYEVTPGRAVGMDLLTAQPAPFELQQ